MKLWDDKKYRCVVLCEMYVQLVIENEIKIVQIRDEPLRTPRRKKKKLSQSEANVPSFRVMRYKFYDIAHRLMLNRYNSAFDPLFFMVNYGGSIRIASARCDVTVVVDKAYNVIAVKRFHIYSDGAETLWVRKISDKLRVQLIRTTINSNRTKEKHKKKVCRSVASAETLQTISPRLLFNKKTGDAIIFASKTTLQGFLSNNSNHFGRLVAVAATRKDVSFHSIMLWRSARISSSDTTQYTRRCRNVFCLSQINKTV